MKRYGVRVPSTDEVVSEIREHKLAWMRLRQQRRRLVALAARPRIKGRWAKGRGRWLTREEMAARMAA